MKKAYVTPSVEVIKVNATSSILAASLTVNDNSGATGDSWQQGQEGQLGRDENPSAPNIWDQQW